MKGTKYILIQKRAYMDSVKSRETRPGWMIHVAMLMNFDPNNQQAHAHATLSQQTM